MTEKGDAKGTGENRDPDVGSVRDYLLYGLTLPERALRTTSAVVGGVLHESASLLIPRAFTSSRSYTMFVQQMLNFMIHDVGGVQQTAALTDVKPEVEQFVARKAVGSFLDMAGWATLHISPITVLALVSDVAYGSSTYLQELSEELKREGIIDADSTIDSAGGLLQAISAATGDTAQSLDMPPLSVEGLKETIEQTRQAAASMDPRDVMPQAEIQRLWDEMHTIARKEDISLLQLSGTMSMYALDKVGAASRGGLSSVRVAGNMFDRHIVSHYSDALKQIGNQGLYPFVAEVGAPYTAAIWENFSGDKETFTGDLVTGKVFGRLWNGLREWYS